MRRWEVGDQKTEVRDGWVGFAKSHKGKYKIDGKVVPMNWDMLLSRRCGKSNMNITTKYLNFNM
jgi:hypothetical protein